MRNWNIFIAKSKSKRFNIHLNICKLEGLPVANGSDKRGNMMKVQIEWGVSKKHFLFRWAAKRNYTSRQRENSDGYVHWNEGFDHACKLRMKGSSAFKSWKINLNIHQSEEEESSTKTSVLAQLSLDISEYAEPPDGSEKIVELPFKCSSGSSAFEAKLTVEISVFMLQDKHINSVIHAVSPTHLLLLLGSCAKVQEETSIRKNSSIPDSDDDPEPEPDPDPSYRSLFTTNLIINSLLDERIIFSKEENWEEDQMPFYRPTRVPSMVRFLSWNNRTLAHRVSDLSRDEPLLKKVSKEDGDDISQSLLPELEQVEHNGDPDEPLSSDRFEIGIWEKRRLISRDKKFELVTDIFLASIDQRSEKASGGGACSVLAIVIADWLHQNPGILPLRCQIDKLIRDGSLEWRNLCKEETHKEKFSDQHFDLDTVIQAQVRPLMMDPAKSPIGFFELENTPSQLEFLQGAKSFDTIWNELQSSDPMQQDIYIGGWNDHFFVLKIEEDAIYMIDTLGERLTEGCDKAYILKFDKASKVYRVHEESDLKVDSQHSSGKQNTGNTGEEQTTKSSIQLVTEGKSSCKEQDTGNTGEEQTTKSCMELISEGKSSCREFIKEFIAAVPLRELQGNIERGIAGGTPIHNLLQIEFHYTTPCTKYVTEHEDKSTSASN